MEPMNPLAGSFLKQRWPLSSPFATRLVMDTFAAGHGMLAAMPLFRIARKLSPGPLNRSVVLYAPPHQARNCRGQTLSRPLELGESWLLRRYSPSAPPSEHRGS